MITPGDPEGDLPSHSVPPGDGVLHAVGQGVAQVKFSRHIGRRDDHHEDVLRGDVLDAVLPTIFGLEKSLFLPPGVPSGLTINIFETFTFHQTLCKIFNYQFCISLLSAFNESRSCQDFGPTGPKKMEILLGRSLLQTQCCQFQKLLPKITENP